MSTRLLVPLLLAALVLASAVGVVWSKHESRKLFVALENLDRERDAMQVEWGQLQLEQSTWATHDRIEETARRRLGLDAPGVDAVVLVSP